MVFNPDFNNSNQDINTLFSSIKNINICDISGINNTFIDRSVKNFKNLMKIKNKFSYFNQSNIKDTELYDFMNNNDLFMRPQLTLQREYDLIVGNNINSNFKYDLAYRNFFYCAKGSIKIKLTPHEDVKYLYIHNDYDTFEFKSTMNVWNTKKEDKKIKNKLNFIDLELKEGECIYIPAYWLYSFKFDETSIIYNFKYYTLMNMISILPYFLFYYLQKTNTKEKYDSNIVDFAKL